MTLFTQSARLPISEPGKAPAVEVVVGVLDRHVLGNVCAKRGCCVKALQLQGASIDLNDERVVEGITAFNPRRPVQGKPSVRVTNSLAANAIPHAIASRLHRDLPHCLLGWGLNLLWGRARFFRRFGLGSDSGRSTSGFVSVLLCHVAIL